MNWKEKARNPSEWYEERASRTGHRYGVSHAYMTRHYHQANVWTEVADIERQARHAYEDNPCKQWVHHGHRSTWKATKDAWVQGYMEGSN